MDIPILNQRLFDFSTLASSATSDVVLVRAIDVTDYRTGVLTVRVHDADYGAGSPTLKVVAYMTSPSKDDPSQDFIGAAKATVVLKDATTQIDADELAKDGLDASFGSHLRIVLEATQATSPDTLQATISADLALYEEA
jgi:hypothetical protein